MQSLFWPGTREMYAVIHLFHPSSLMAALVQLWRRLSDSVPVHVTWNLGEWTSDV